MLLISSTVHIWMEATQSGRQRGGDEVGGKNFFFHLCNDFLVAFLSAFWSLDLNKSVFGAVTLFELTVTVRAFQVTAICSLWVVCK